MAQIKVPKEPVIKSKKYTDLKGADFSCDGSLVDKARSPLPINLISAEGGNPCKRLGWRVLFQLEAPVHNIWYGEIEGKRKIVAHAGTKLYDVSGHEAVELQSGLNSAKGTGFFMRKNERGYLFFTDGKDYRYYDGETSGLVSDIATRPKVLISRLPNGGGTAYESANLLTGKKTVAFLGDDASTTYVLPYTDLESIDEVRVRNSNGTYEVTTAYTADLAKGTIVFTSAHAPVVTGQDNVEVDFTKTTEGYYDRIAKCTISTAYGLNAQNRVFLSGNTDYEAYDWYSEIYDPTYFADTSYAIVGTTDTAIMGYAKLGEYLAVIKEDNSQDTTIFLRYGELTGEKTIFKTKQGVVGLGAISKHCFYNLGDEPLFLTRLGVYAVTSTVLSYERVVKNRSFRLDKKLTNEKDLKNAVACEWNGYYIVAVNGNAYVLDGRRKSGTGTNNEYAYEAYYWQNIPAVCFLSLNGELYFGTEDGRFCKFNTDISKPSTIYAYNDEGNFEIRDGVPWYVDGGKAIPCQWATPNDDDGGVHIFKKLMKKGCLVVLSPFERSSAEVYFSVDGEFETLIASGIMDIFNWESLDFERVTFNSNDSPQEIYFNKRIRKYKRLQIIIKNDVINEPFGIHEIIKTFTLGNYSK